MQQTKQNQTNTIKNFWYTTVATDFDVLADNLEAEDLELYTNKIYPLIQNYLGNKDYMDLVFTYDIYKVGEMLEKDSKLTNKYNIKNTNCDVNIEEYKIGNIKWVKEISKDDPKSNIYQSYYYFNNKDDLNNTFNYVINNHPEVDFGIR